MHNNPLTKEFCLKKTLAIHSVENGFLRFTQSHIILFYHFNITAKVNLLTVISQLHQLSPKPFNADRIIF